MNAARAGTAIAVAVAGWPLYRLVTAGDLDATSALLRGGVVAAACAYGVTLILRLTEGYELQAQVERKKRLNQLFGEMEVAAAEGSLTSENSAGKPAAAAAPPAKPAPLPTERSATTAKTPASTAAKTP